MSTAKSCRPRDSSWSSLARGQVPLGADFGDPAGLEGRVRAVVEQGPVPVRVDVTGAHGFVAGDELRFSLGSVVGGREERFAGVVDAVGME
jgi:hypothetical protein